MPGTMLEMCANDCASFFDKKASFYCFASVWHCVSSLSSLTRSCFFVRVTTDWFIAVQSS